MTRLTEEHIKNISANCKVWDRYLKAQTGIGFLDIASRVSGKSLGEIKEASRTYNVFVVPVTSGQGRIVSFSESIAAIIGAMGFTANVTECSDVDGIYEAYRRGGDIIFMADEDRYIAINIKNGNYGENNLATAAGYVEIMDSRIGGLQGKDVLQIGYGAVGKLMALALIDKNATVTVFDKDPAILGAAEADGFMVIKSREHIKSFELIADASSEGGWLTNELLPESPVIVSPGVPLSLDDSAQNKHRDRFFHDPLDIGTAGMLGMSV